MGLKKTNIAITRGGPSFCPKNELNLPDLEPILAHSQRSAWFKELRELRRLERAAWLRRPLEKSSFSSVGGLGFTNGRLTEC
jgi:hypothetical protein